MSTIQFAAEEDAAELIRELNGEGFSANLRQVSDQLWELDVEPWDDRVVAMVDVYGGWLPGDARLPDGGVATDGGLTLQVLGEERHLRLRQPRRNRLLRRHVRDPGQRQHRMRPAGGEKCGGQLQRVRGEDVVVGQAVDQ